MWLSAKNKALQARPQPVNPSGSTKHNQIQPFTKELVRAVKSMAWHTPVDSEAQTECAERQRFKDVVWPSNPCRKTAHGSEMLPGCDCTHAMYLSIECLATSNTGANLRHLD